MPRATFCEPPAPGHTYRNNSTGRLSVAVEHNVNHSVWVRLTDRGREVYAAYYADLEARSGMAFRAPEIQESNGWSRWQMHSLMQHFGAAMIMGPLPPFETNIRIEIDA